jgi:uncharacterized protein
MKRLLRIAASAAVLCACASMTACGDDPAPAAVGTDGSFRMLVFTRTAGFRHASIPTGIATIQSLGAANNFSVDATEDPTAFTDDNLAQYTVVAFVNTTGDFLDDTQQGAFERYVRGGGGFVGVHSASDGEYDWPFYGELIGAYFDVHPLPAIYSGGQFSNLGVQPGTFVNEAPDHPAVAHLPAAWRISDEFYSYRTNPREQVRVLLSIDEGSYLPDPNTSVLTPTQIRSGRMGDHPMSWCHDNLGGRAFYTNVGHAADIYQDADYVLHLLNGILTAARRLDADCGSGQ